MAQKIPMGNQETGVDNSQTTDMNIYRDGDEVGSDLSVPSGAEVLQEERGGMEKSKKGEY